MLDRQWSVWQTSWRDLFRWIPCCVNFWYHLTAPNALKSDLIKPRICPIWGQSDPLWSQTYHPCLVMYYCWIHTFSDNHNNSLQIDWYRKCNWANTPKGRLLNTCTYCYFYITVPFEMFNGDIEKSSAYILREMRLNDIDLVSFIYYKSFW